MQMCKPFNCIHNSRKSPLKQNSNSIKKFTHFTENFSLVDLKNLELKFPPEKHKKNNKININIKWIAI